MKVHPSVTIDRIIAAIEGDDYIGFCIKCGAERDRCEPDAREYECEECEEKAVYGAEELLIMIGDSP
jgi:hypothetical protein